MQLLSLWVLTVAIGAFPSLIICAAFSPKNERLLLTITLCALSAIGATAGITGGLSRTGAVGDVIPAALGLLGGVVVWLFAADKSKGDVVSLCAIGFSLSLFVGYFEAAARRSNPESYDFWRSACVEQYSKKDIVSDPLTFSVVQASYGTICSQIFTAERLALLSKRVPQAEEQVPKN